MKQIILTFAILLLTVELFGQSKSIEGRDIPQSGLPLYVNIDFVTTSDIFYRVEETNEFHERWNNGIKYDVALSYRISFIVNEIYYSLLVETISNGMTEGDEKRVIERYFYNGFDLTDDILKMGRLTNLDFKSWNKFNSFQLQESDQTLQFEILQNGILKIEKI